MNRQDAKNAKESRFTTKDTKTTRNQELRTKWLLTFPGFLL